MTFTFFQNPARATCTLTGQPVYLRWVDLQLDCACFTTECLWPPNCISPTHSLQNKHTRQLTALHQRACGDETCKCRKPAKAPAGNRLLCAHRRVQIAAAAMADTPTHRVSASWLAENLERSDVKVLDASWYLPTMGALSILLVSGGTQGTQTGVPGSPVVLPR